MTPVSDQVETPFKGSCVPPKANLDRVAQQLQANSLPDKLALQIMNAADYPLVRRLLICDNPLHVADADDLKST